MKTVVIKFPTSSQSYNYLYDLNAPIAVGDHVIVDSPYNGLCAVKVIEIKESGGTKYVVAKVDLTEYEEKQRKREEAKKVKAELDKRMKAMESTLKYQLLASIDPTAAELIEQLNRLEK